MTAHILQNKNILIGDIRIWRTNLVRQVYKDALLLTSSLLK